MYIQNVSHADEVKAIEVAIVGVNSQTTVYLSSPSSHLKTLIPLSPSSWQPRNCPPLTSLEACSHNQLEEKNGCIIYIWLAVSIFTQCGTCSCLRLIQCAWKYLEPHLFFFPESDLFTISMSVALSSSIYNLGSQNNLTKHFLLWK